MSQIKFHTNMVAYETTIETLTKMRFKENFQSLKRI